ncbi:MAG: alpha/beta hydrolase [Acidobacteriota bacterium]|nr:alpha/beta hydrolase [Acidobacteriota bacterium]
MRPRLPHPLWLMLLAAPPVAEVASQVPDPVATFDLAGHWEGEIELPGSPLQVMLDFAAADGGWRGTIDIPAQAAFGLPLEGVAVDGERVRFTISGVPGTPTFDGAHRAGEIVGGFAQGAARLPFRLGRDAVAPPARPQDPLPPLPYGEHEVVYPSGEVTLAGTLTLPPGPGPFPGVVLVSGSGPQNRDEELYGHRPFRVLADALARRGIAVLRSDDRGVGGSSGDLETATTVDLAADALAAVELLRARPEVAAERVGILGHSEGGLVGPIAANRSAAVAFVVLLAGPGVSGGALLPVQTERLALAMGGDPQTVAAQRALVEEAVDLLSGEEDDATLRAALAEVARRQLELGGEPARQALGDDPQAAIARQIDRLLTPWFRFFVLYDPRPALMALRVPVLAVNGTLDLQVDAEQNLTAIERALTAAGNPDWTVRRLAGLNHLFQHATTGSTLEYGQIEETLAPELLELIGDWILERFGSE